MKTTTFNQIELAQIGALIAMAITIGAIYVVG